MTSQSDQQKLQDSGWHRVLIDSFLSIMNVHQLIPYFVLVHLLLQLYAICMRMQASIYAFGLHVSACMIK